MGFFQRLIRKLFRAPSKGPERAGGARCVQCGKTLTVLHTSGKICVGGDELRRAELRCDRCLISFCMECAGRQDMKTSCPRCRTVSNPPMFVPPGL